MIKKFLPGTLAGDQTRRVGRCVRLQTEQKRSARGCGYCLAPASQSAGQPTPVPHAGVGQNLAERYWHAAALLQVLQHLFVMNDLYISPSKKFIKMGPRAQSKAPVGPT